MRSAFSIIGKMVVVTIALTGFQATAATTYILKVTNGSAMPISPAVIYIQNGQAGKARVGQAPTPALIKLCQMGDPSMRATELDAAADVTNILQTSMPILPGESRELEVAVQDPLKQSIHFESMYGKTKDVCAVGSFGSHSLYALKQHVTSEVFGKDNVVATGAYLDPRIPNGQNYLDGNLCTNEMDAVSCLRSLSPSNPGPARIRFFSSYLSSVVMLLESRYGADEMQSLIIPSSGAVELSLKLKH